MWWEKHGVFIDEKDKEVDAVRQCLFRAMISTQQAPRWVFKDFELGWLEVDEDYVGDEVSTSRDREEEVLEEEPLPVMYGWFNWVKDYFGPVFDIFTFLWSLVFTKEVKAVSSIVDDQVASHEIENKDDLYCTAPLPSHPQFPSVLDLLDCDSPWLKKFLVDKAGIDKILVVPKFEDATTHVENIDSKYTLAGTLKCLLKKEVNHVGDDFKNKFLYKRLIKKQGLRRTRKLRQCTN